MRILFRYIGKCMAEKKSRVFLVLLSVMLCTALMTLCLGVRNMVVDTMTGPYITASEGNDVIITPSTGNYFLSKDLKTEGITNKTGELDAQGVIVDNDEIINVSLSGRKNFGKKILEGAMPTGTKEGCLISDRVAKNRNLKVGDKIKISIFGEETTFEVKGIAVNDGIFYADGKKSFTVIVSYDYLDKKFDADGRYNVIKGKASGEDLNKTIENFNKIHKDCKASKLVDVDVVGFETITFGLIGMLTIVCLISGLIINGIFKLIINERMTVFGTFMSQGAGRTKVEGILLLESAMYGLIGGALGVALSQALIIIINRVISPLAEYGIYNAYKPNFAHMGAALVFALVLTTVSALMPIRKIRKYQVKDVILNRLDEKVRSGNAKFVVGIILLIASAVCRFVDAEIMVKLSPIMLALFLAGVVCTIPKTVKLLSGLFGRLFRRNATLYIAFNNIRTSKLLRSNITLLVLSVSAILVMVSIGNGMKSVVIDAYNTMNIDYEIDSIPASGQEQTTTDTIIEKLAAMDSVDEDSMAVLYSAHGTVKGNEVLAYGTDLRTFTMMMGDYITDLKDPAFKATIDEFENSKDDSILLSKKVAKNGGIKVGDKVELEINSIRHDFKVTGLVDSKLFNNGVVSFIKEDTLKDIYNITEANAIGFNIKGPASKAEKDFKKTLLNLGCAYTSKETMMENNVRDNKMVTDILSIFTYIALFVAAIGIFNNIAISFAQRRKEFAVMSSVGMNSGSRKRLILIENISGGVWSIIMAFPVLVVMIGLVQKTFEYIDLGFPLGLELLAYGQYSLVIIGIMILASISAMKKSRKLSIVQELKYE